MQDVMNFFFLRPPAKRWEDEPGSHTLITIQKPHNTAEGGEYLDDAIRMKDQPLIYTEESIASGCLEGLV
jgi:hypothetical protein